MTENDFNYYLSWILILNAIPSLIASITCVLFFNIVERKGSKIIFVIGFLTMFATTVFRTLTSYDFTNYSMRLLNGLVIVMGGMVGSILFYWSYAVQKRERLKRTEAEQKLAESLPVIKQTININPDEVLGMIKKLTPKQAAVLAHKFKHLRY